MRTASIPHLPRGLVVHLLDELRHEGPSREFWDRYWSLAPRLKADDLALVRRAAERPVQRPYRLPLHV